MSRNRGKRQPARRLMVESLESRALLASNITATVTDGLLRIQGDNADNWVRVRQMKQTFTGEWPGVKLEITSATGTVNGQNAAAIVNAKTGVMINLLGGDDRLVANNLTPGPDIAGSQTIDLPGKVGISAGSGSDEIEAFVENHQQFSVHLGESNGDSVEEGDKLTIRYSELSKLNITTLGDSNTIISGGTEIRNRGNIKAGIGSDHIFVNGNVDFRRDVNIDLGNGGRDELTLMAVLGGATTLLAGGENNVIEIGGAINGPFTANIGPGNTSFHVRSDCTSTSVLHVTLGSGHDEAVIRNTRIAGIHLDGGEGDDILHLVSTNPNGDNLFTNFEDIREDGT